MSDTTQSAQTISSDLATFLSTLNAVEIEGRKGRIAVNKLRAEQAAIEAQAALTALRAQVTAENERHDAQIAHLEKMQLAQQNRQISALAHTQRVTEMQTDIIKSRRRGDLAKLEGYYDVIDLGSTLGEKIVRRISDGVWAQRGAEISELEDGTYEVLGRTFKTRSAAANARQRWWKKLRQEERKQRELEERYLGGVSLKTDVNPF